MKKILQAFKKLFHKKSRPLKAYCCDSGKNTKCVKIGCWYMDHSGPCKCTLNRKYAKRDDHGKPIVATDDDLYNLDYWDEQIAKLSESD